jgi:MFS family permease
MLSVLRQPNFARLWIGQLISILGDQLLGLALPFYIFDQTHSTLATGLMVAVQTIPGLIFSSLAGVFVDRWERRRLMFTADLLRAGVLVVLLGFHSNDYLWVIYLVAFLQSTISQFFNPAKSALLVQLLHKEVLVQANSLNQISNTIATLFGPALGGLLLGLFGLEVVILLDIGSYLFSALLIYLIKLNTPSPSLSTSETEKPGVERRFWRQWLAGFTILRKNRLIRLIFGVMGLAFFAEGMVAALLVPFIQIVLKGDAQVMGWCATAQGVGGLVGGVVVGHLGQRFRPRRLLSLCLGLISLTYFLIATFPVLPLVLTLLLLFGIPTVTALVTFQTLLQQNVESEYQGRIFGSYGALISLALLLGAGIGATIGNFTGPLVVLYLVAALHLLTGLIIAVWGSILR